jgi:ABC-type polysaccharide/polyol phosphate export permease
MVPVGFQGMAMQHGDILFLLQNLVLKDFRIRYRNMSLGVIWSVANPLLMMGILTFVFTRIYPNPTIHHFALFALCALVPFNFYSLAAITGTTSLLENQSLIKRVRCPRAIFPIAAVLSSSLHFLIQIALLIILLLVFGHMVNRYWLWLVPIWTMEIVFLCGLSLITSALDIYYRDTRYLVECSGLVMFWMVPIFYNLEMIPQRYRMLYTMNPIAAVAIIDRQVMLAATAPSMSLLFQLSAVSLAVLALGFMIFGRLEHDLADYL